MKIKRPDDTEFDTTSEDWHIAGHARHAKTAEEAVHYVATYRDEIEREHREVCICAAIQLKKPNGETAIIRGHRHHDCIAAVRLRVKGVFGEASNDQVRAALEGSEQGFVTSRNRFVGRKEGMELQLAAGVPSAMTEHGLYRGSLLFSEDLYG